MSIYRLEKTETDTGEKHIIASGLDMSIATAMKTQAEQCLTEAISLCEEREKVPQDIPSLGLTYPEDQYDRCPLAGTFEIVEE